MSQPSYRLEVHILTSGEFPFGAPIVIAELLRRGHYVSTYDELNMPRPAKLLSCDVMIDMSAITSRSFYASLRREYTRRQMRSMNPPLIVDPPGAILNSLDKRVTHRSFRDLVPESYNLHGLRNKQLISRFCDDQYVVVKPAKGWWGRGIERLSPADAKKKYCHTKGYIVQKYIQPENGIGRVVTLSYQGRVKVVCSYTRFPESWRTGVDTHYSCMLVPVTASLLEFVQEVSVRCGLVLNGIDYVFSGGRYYLLEVNAVPAIREPLEEFGIDVSQHLIDLIEAIHSADSKYANAPTNRRR